MRTLTTMMGKSQMNKSACYYRVNFETGYAPSMYLKADFALDLCVALTDRVLLYPRHSHLLVLL